MTPIFGEAKLVAPGKVRVGDQELTAKHVIVATGARAKVFPGIELDGQRIVTYREAIVRDQRPSKVTVSGAGAIGLAFAHFRRGMGADATGIEGHPEILPREDDEVAQACRKHLEKLGIQFVLGTFGATAKVADERGRYSAC